MVIPAAKVDHWTIVTAGGTAVLDNGAVIIDEKLMRKLLIQGQIEAVGIKINTSH